MLKIADFEPKQYLDVENIQKLPLGNLKTIDNLWMKYSNNLVKNDVNHQIFAIRKTNPGSTGSPLTVSGLSKISGS